jgi:hypothetical protein
MNEKVQSMIGFTLIGGVVLNLLMALNLYRQVGNLEYKVNQTNESLYLAVGSLSTDVHSLKNSKPYNRTGQFE